MNWFKIASFGCALPGALLLVACGGSQSPATAPDEPAEEAATSATAPPAESEPEQQPPAPATWAEATTPKQKGAFMKAHVVPRMGELFKGFDAEEYAEFGCSTCHGSDFKMPKDHLPSLTFSNGKLTAFEEHPEVAKFMAEQVLPSMVEILGQQPYDPKTNQGFGCNGCHSIEMK